MQTRLVPLGDGVTRAAGLVGAKAARLARAAGAGLPVLPGWVVPVTEAAPALSAGAAAIAHGRPAAARRAVLGYRLDDGLAAELREAVTRLGGRVIVRSSSPLESDPRWSGAFSSVAEVGVDDAVSAVRSCWASAFAVDPLERLAACGLPPAALQLGVLLQPEIRLAAGGVARVMAEGSPCGAAGTAQAGSGGAAGTEVIVEGVLGHPGALLAGWAEGTSAHVQLPGGARSEPARPRVRAGHPGGGQLTGLLGTELVTAVAALAGRVWQALGDDLIEWAAGDGGIWLLQSLRSAPVPGHAASARGAGHAPMAGQGPGRLAPPATVAGLLASRAWMPLLAATVLGRGEHVPARPAAPGTAAGRLVACRPHERPPGGTADAILLVDRPLPALAPLLFSARGVIARTGAPGSHLAEVARSLGVPMVTGCRPETVTGPGLGAPHPPGGPESPGGPQSPGGPRPPGRAGGWLAAVDGSTGDVALMPGTDGVMAQRFLQNEARLHQHSPVPPVVAWKDDQ
jgi:phosphohistidine swiveling domain-containing protein